MLYKRNLRVNSCIKKLNVKFKSNKDQIFNGKMKRGWKTTYTILFSCVKRRTERIEKKNSLNHSLAGANKFAQLSSSKSLNRQSGKLLNRYMNEMEKKP